MLVQRSYPHMGAMESEVWRSFLASGRCARGDVYYAARVGTSLPVPVGSSEYLRALVRATSRLRIDAVVRSGDTWWLYEVKVRAGLSAIGQAIGYQILMSDLIRGPASVVSCIVAWTSIIDLPVIAERCGIGLYLVTSDHGPRWQPPAFVPV